jgi:L-threonylcarbamoyladenylate synthase
VDPVHFRADDLLPAVNAIHAGGLVAFPTDTLYGLAADPRSPSAVSRIFVSKRRAPDRPIPLVAASVEQVRQSVGTLTPLGERLASQWWPGPLTLIIPGSASRFEALQAWRFACRIGGGSRTASWWVMP